MAIWPVTGQGFQNTKGAIHSTKIPTGPTGKSEARSIQPQFPEISVQNSMDRFDSTGKVSVLYKSIGNLVAGHLLVLLRRNLLLSEELTCFSLWFFFIFFIQ